MKEDLTGRKFGRLTVLHLNGRGSWWVCQCTCGNKRIVQQHQLLRGEIKSCGCLQKEHRSSTLKKASKKAGDVHRKKAQERRSNVKERILQEYGGTDIREIVVRVLNEEGLPSAAARKLGIGKQMISDWIQEMKIEKVWR